MTNETQISHDVNIKLDDETNAQIDISGNASTVSVTPSYRTGTYMAFGQAWDSSNDGGKGWTAEVQIYFSVNAAEAYRDILLSWKASRGARTLTVSAPDASAGSIENSGECRLDGDTPLEFDRTSDEVVQVTFSVIGDGALAETMIT